MTIEELKTKASELGTMIRLLDEKYDLGETTDDTERMGARRTYTKFLNSIQDAEIRRQADDAFWDAFCPEEIDQP